MSFKKKILKKTAYESRMNKVTGIIYKILMWQRESNLVRNQHSGGYFYILPLSLIRNEFRIRVNTWCY